jgi:hypothetical protein
VEVGSLVAVGVKVNVEVGASVSVGRGVSVAVAMGAVLHANETRMNHVAVMDKTL